MRADEGAARIAIEAFQSARNDGVKNDLMMHTAILNGIEHANQTVQELGLAVVEIGEGEIRPYHVCDSMMLVEGQRGAVKLQTVCYSPVRFGVAEGLLDASEDTHHEDRHLISNVIGTADLQVELGSTVKLAPPNTLLLASDGLLTIYI